jgi:hypothetical protein
MQRISYPVAAHVGVGQSRGRRSDRRRRGGRVVAVTRHGLENGRVRSA